MRMLCAGALLFAIGLPAISGPVFTDANWTSLGGNPGLNGQVMALALNPGTGALYLGGQFTMAGATPALYVVGWQGTNWFALGNGFPNFGYNSANARPQLVTDAAGNLYGLGQNNVAKWNGTNWSNLATNIALPLAVASDHNGGVYVGGRFNYVDGALAQNIARWDGTNWSGLGTGCVGQGVTFLGADFAGKLFVGGNFTNVGGLVSSNIASWDGTNWFALGPGLDFSSDSFASGVRDIIADASGNIYVGGQYLNAGGDVFSRVAKWDGTNWFTLASSDLGNDTINALALDSAGNLYVAGNFYSIGRIGISLTYARNIAKWDGTNWSALGSGVNGQVNALLYDGNGHLLVGGNFLKAGTNVSPYFAEAIIGTATNPPTLTISSIASGGVSLSWPLDHVGWRLQLQSNAPGVGITSNWFTIPGTTNLNATNFPVNPGAGSVFYRLAYP